MQIRETTSILESDDENAVEWDAAQASLLFTPPPCAQQRDYGGAKEKLGDRDALMQGVFTAPRRRGWKISTPRYME